MYIAVLFFNESVKEEKKMIRKIGARNSPFLPSACVTGLKPKPSEHEDKYSIKREII